MAPSNVREAYEAFWTKYLETVRLKQPTWRGIGTATSENYVYQSCSVPDCRIGAAFKHDGRLAHELVIMSRDADGNLEAFRGLSARRKEVELSYGRHLTWAERPTRKRCLIGDYAIGTVTNTWATDMYVEWFIDCGVRLRRVLDEFGSVIVESGTAS